MAPDSRNIYLKLNMRLFQHLPADKLRDQERDFGNLPHLLITKKEIGNYYDFV